MPALLCLHDPDLPEAVKCTPLPSTVIGSFFGTMSVSDFLLSFWIPASFLRFGFHTFSFQGDSRISAVPYNIIIINLAKLSDWGMPLFPRPIGHKGVVCCVCKRIDHFQPYIYFPAQSLHFRFGSVAPCPTLKSDVTASTPRTRYRRLAKPYLTGFSCFILSAYKDRQKYLLLPVEISYADFSARATYSMCEPSPNLSPVPKKHRLAYLHGKRHSLVDMGITPHTPIQNRTCATNAYGFSLYIHMLST